MRVAVLGSGPAGLMAAHAVITAHQNREAFLDIYSLGEKSSLYGAQYLHAPIPYITKDGARTVDYRLVGDPDDYRRKVYGQMWQGPVSPEDLTGMQQAWDIRQTYDALWALYSPAIVPTVIDPIGLQNIVDAYDVVINTIPLDAICYKGHHFGYTEVIAAGDAPDRGIDVGKSFRCNDDTVICNGNESPAWYRLSRIFGHTTVEWPSKGPELYVPVSTAAFVRKPTDHDCNCWPKIVKVGRYGSWTKGVLSHRAYFDTYLHIESMMRENV